MSDTQKTDNRFSGNTDNRLSAVIPKKNDEINNIINKDTFFGEINSKNAHFLFKKITIETNEKYIKIDNVHKNP